jgi:hypothetical protein
VGYLTDLDEAEGRKQRKALLRRPWLWIFFAILFAWISGHAIGSARPIHGHFDAMAKLAIVNSLLCLLAAVLAGISAARSYRAVANPPARVSKPAAKVLNLE